MNTVDEILDLNPLLWHKLMSTPYAMMPMKRMNNHMEATGMEKINSMMDLLDRFRTEKDCVEYLYDMRTEDGWTCPRCGGHSCSLLSSRRKIQCTRCSHQESVTRDTAMYQTHIPLRKWFLAIYMIAGDRRGISALYLSHELHVKWESAYYMLERIRSAMAEKGCLQHAFWGA